MTGKQELALQIAAKAVRDWREEEARAADGVAHSRSNALLCLRKAEKAGVSQSDLARACDWPRQRVHQLLNEIFH